MISQTNLLSQSSSLLTFSSNSYIFIPKHHHHQAQSLQFSSTSSIFSSNLSLSSRSNLSSISMATSNSDIQTDILQLGFDKGDIDRFAVVANKLADASGEVIRSFFRNKFEILDKDDLSPVTIADRTAEEAMVSLIMENFPSHAIFGEEMAGGVKKAFGLCMGKPLFGTLIALLYKGKPILGMIDQPILRERWIGISGKRTTLNGQEISTRSCANLSQLLQVLIFLLELLKMHSFVLGIRLRCHCMAVTGYAYALLASGFVDLVVESAIRLPCVDTVINGAGGTITDWERGRTPLGSIVRISCNRF
ncbi:Bifunctional phosphatase IMPL2 chloroplastic [Bienertia sinuspersici]